MDENILIFKEHDIEVLRGKSNIIYVTYSQMLQKLISIRNGKANIVKYVESV